MGAKENQEGAEGLEKGSPERGFSSCFGEGFGSGLLIMTDWAGRASILN